MPAAEDQPPAGDDVNRASPPRQRLLRKPAPIQADECRFRREVRPEGDSEIACCRLLEEIAGVAGAGLCAVRRDACDACCRSERPSTAVINDVIASLLYALTDQVMDNTGVPGCGLEKAARLRQWAERNLRWIDVDQTEDDDESLPPGIIPQCIYLSQRADAQKGPPEEDRRSVTAGRCRHPEHAGATSDECYLCRDWTYQPPKAALPLDRLLGPPAERYGPSVARWAVGVTVSPRRRPTLVWCLDSLIRAGWEHPWLFVDSAVEIADRHAHLPVTLRETRSGAWPNYLLALVELLMRAPEADAFLLVQDDVILFDHENLRAYMERILWPGDDVGAVSLYCSKAYTQSEPGWHKLARKWVWGAQAFIFPRESARQFVIDPRVFEHRWSGPNRGSANIDVVIGEWAVRTERTIWFPTPSLAQHIGETSTLWQLARVKGKRIADQFAGDARPGG